jgi:hypothetical protein
MKVNIHFQSYLAHLFLEWKILRIKVTEKLETHILCWIIFFFFENRAVYEIMWKNIVERGRSQIKIWHMRIACWIPKAKNTHTLGLCNIHSFPRARIVERTRLSVTLHGHCLSCCYGLELKKTVPTRGKMPSVSFGTYVMKWAWGSVVSLGIFSEASEKSMCPGSTQPLRNEYQDIPGGKGGRCVGLTTLPP